MTVVYLCASNFFFSSFFLTYPFWLFLSYAKYTHRRCMHEMLGAIHSTWENYLRKRISKDLCWWCLTCECVSVHVYRHRFSLSLHFVVVVEFKLILFFFTEHNNRQSIWYGVGNSFLLVFLVCAWSCALKRNTKEWVIAKILFGFAYAMSISFLVFYLLLCESIFPAD